ncbi:hypothetical protein [Kineosporia succinea]|uniref:Lipoprotein n=1 Tax=Kineosporia succinea TaxID=84632 RepID=A0ABT9P846_9ACTN|nr:hypothetical protein [Kineosporia succinea]MDP9828874.1 hypothetical protein [Kineosporia succinea]
MGNLRSALAVAAVTVLLTSACTSESGGEASARPTASASNSVTVPAEATPVSVGSSGEKVSAAVASDPGTVAQLREIVARQVRAGRKRYQLESPALVDITALGEVGQVRYAVAVYPTRLDGRGEPFWNEMFLLAPAGGDAGDFTPMHAASEQVAIEDSIVRNAEAVFLRYREPTDEAVAGAVVVYAPGATDVTVKHATGELTYDGTSSWAVEVSKIGPDDDTDLDFTTEGGSGTRGTTVGSWPFTK